jgi:hypothetical protein
VIVLLAPEDVELVKSAAMTEELEEFASIL